MIHQCNNCKNKEIKHEFQDKRYGLFIRVMNKTSKTEKHECRCTVCGFNQDGVK